MPLSSFSLLKMMHGRHLAIRKFSCKKDCEEMISIFSQSLSVISFKPSCGKKLCSISFLLIFTSLRLEWYFLPPPEWIDDKLLRSF